MSWLLLNVTKRPWNLNQFTGVNYTMVDMGTANALVDYGDTTTVIGLSNLKPGNGDFGRLMDYLEGEAESQHKTVEIVEIWNKRLKEHFIAKRGYHISPNGVVK